VREITRPEFCFKYICARRGTFAPLERKSERGGGRGKSRLVWRKGALLPILIQKREKEMWLVSQWTKQKEEKGRNEQWRGRKGGKKKGVGKRKIFHVSNSNTSKKKCTSLND